jgi:TM2 domain-containing membrane protein YozV
MRGVETAPAAGAHPHPVTGKNPVLALVLSLVICGVGQFYNSDVKKGALMLIGFVLGIFISGGLISFGLWVWSMIDAYLVASGKGKVW